MHHTLTTSGTVKITISDHENNITKTKVYNNRIVDSGVNYIVEMMLGNSQPVFSHIGIGTNSTPAVKTDITLQNEILRLPLTEINNSTNVVVYNLALGPNEPNTELVLSEVGLFNANTAGTMFARVGFPPIVKTVNDSLTISWIITIQPGN
jgi:hypothetical protein